MNMPQYMIGQGKGMGKGGTVHQRCTSLGLPTKIIIVISLFDSNTKHFLLIFGSYEYISDIINFDRMHYQNPFSEY